jgi:selT/selW/selH-like putative selenoprotein
MKIRSYFLFLLLFLLSLNQQICLAVEEDSFLDGFDEDTSSKRTTISQIDIVEGLKPYQIEVFISYCMAWQGRGSFQQLKNFLESKFPREFVKVVGGEHPPTSFAALALKLANIAQVFGTVFAFGGEQLINFLGLQRNPMAIQLIERKMQVLMFSFLFNSIAQSMAKTDAFEIFMNGEKIFSKLETKRYPTVQELLLELSKRGVELDMPSLTIPDRQRKDI